MDLKQDYNNHIEKARTYEALVMSEGWKNLLALYQVRVSQFSTRAIKQGFESEKQMELERGKILGMGEFIGEVQSDLDFLKQEREKNNGEPTSE